MRKLTEKHKNWLLHKSKRLLSKKMQKSRTMQPTSTLLNDAGSQRVATRNVRPLPGMLCFDFDLVSTVDFFNKFRTETKLPRKNFSRMPTSKKKGRIKQLANFYDFEPLRQITPGAALVLAAEFDRINIVNRQSPTSINIEKWDDTTYGVLFHLGFFQLLGFSENKIRTQAAVRPPHLNQLNIVPMVSGHLADVSKGAEALQMLFREIGTTDEVSLALMSAIIDAVENVVGHAYDDLVIADRKLIPRKWWLSGSFDANKKILKVYLFDQGATIPLTLPIKWGREKLFAKVLSEFGVGPWKDHQDGAAIRAAVKLSTTSSGISSRGKGLHKIKENVSELKGGRLVILSRRGHYAYENGQESCFAMESALLGTYLELTAEL